jgi:hypothetical protein
VAHVLQIDSLRCARDILLIKAEQDSKEIFELSHENQRLRISLKESEIEREECKEQLVEMQRQLSVCRHQYLDARTRADSQEISIGALKLKLKMVTTERSAPTRTSTESLLISSDNVEDIWETFVTPLQSLGEGDFGASPSETEINSEDASRSNTERGLRSKSLFSPNSEDQNSHAEESPARAAKRCRSQDEINESMQEVKVENSSFLSKVVKNCTCEPELRRYLDTFPIQKSRRLRVGGTLARNLHCLRSI